MIHVMSRESTRGGTVVAPGPLLLLRSGYGPRGPGPGQRKERELAAEYVRRFQLWHAASDFRDCYTVVSPGVKCPNIGGGGAVMNMF